MQKKPNHKFPIVGIGASAGGLETVSELLGRLPIDTGMAWVFIQHLDPKHESLLAGLLAKTTKMPVIEAADGLPVEPNKLYVIPPNSNMSLLHGRIMLEPRTETRGQHMAIDHFFRSLAEDLGSNSIGVVLSGTGSDGSAGLKAIKAKGGITMAQDPASARYDGMPSSAIATGGVDLVLATPDLADELVRLARHPRHFPAESQSVLERIFLRLRSQSGVDFSSYKPSTVQRRIARRMALAKLETVDEYLDYLTDNPAELMALHDDLLISVTNFFRDPATFDTLKEKAFPKIVDTVAARGEEDAVRIWVPGCATGEEAYSIAIALLEFMENVPSRPRVQIFASDISEAAVQTARAGVYPESIAADVSPERLSRYFDIVDGGGYRISKRIRESCVFAKHDVTRDPPFSRLDLISCRNVLIYFGRDLQNKVLPMFHYALREGGFLMLGGSETTTGFAKLFTIVDKKDKIYTKKSHPAHLPIGFGRDYISQENKRRPAPPVRQAKQFDAGLAVDRMLLDNYVPAGVLINEDMEILQFRGHTRDYLEQRPGKPTLNLLNMARDGLSLDLRTAVKEAIERKQRIVRENIRVQVAGDYRQITIQVTPIVGPAGERYLLVLFLEGPASGAGAIEIPSTTRMPDRYIDEQELTELRQELWTTKSYLESVIEEKEGAGEEMRAASEEIQSSNEELQSLNEEMETAKEELQSTNEELTTVNDELQSRNSELGQLSDDLTNLLASIKIPTIMLGNDLRIRRFTPDAERVMNVVAADVGRPLTDLKMKVDVPDISDLIRTVHDSMIPIEREVRDEQGHWLVMRIRPYRTSDDRIDGTVLTFQGIDEMKRSLLRVEGALHYADSLVRTVPQPFLVLDPALRVLSASESFYGSFQVSKEKTEGRLIQELGDGQWDIAELRELLEKVRSTETEVRDFEVSHDFPQIGPKTMLVTASSIRLEAEEPQRILVSLQDVTESTLREQFSNALNDINSAVNSTLQFDDLMERIVKESAAVVGSESVAVCMREDGLWVTRYVFNLPLDRLGTTFTDEEAANAVLAASTRRPVAVENALGDRAVNVDVMSRYEVRSVLTVPLLARNEVIGVIFYNYHSASVQFTDLQVDFAAKLAAAISLAMENTRLYEAEHHIAQTLQTALLPAPREYAGIDYAFLYHSATEAATVGGDFYDLFELDKNLLGVTIGDVSGKGIEAASLTAVAKNTIRAYALEGHPPAEVMAKTNEVVRRTPKTSAFITVFFGILDRRNGVLTYCNAGHPPGLIRKSDLTIASLTPSSPIIGALKEFRYVEERAELEPGDMLLLYTDGITEAKGDNGMLFGEAHLAALLGGAPVTSARELPRYIFRKIRDYTGDRMTDDVLCLALSVKSTS